MSKLFEENCNTFMFFCFKGFQVIGLDIRALRNSCEDTNLLPKFTALHLKHGFDGF